MEKRFSPIVGWLAPANRPAGRRVQWIFGETPQEAATSTTMAAALAAAGVRPVDPEFLVFSHPAALLPDGSVSPDGETTLDGREAIKKYFSRLSPRQPADGRLALQLEGRRGWLWGAKAPQAVGRQIRDASAASRKYGLNFLVVHDGQETIVVCGERIAADDVRYPALRRRFPR